jgi:predicted membrane-bound spermidine synthase
MAVITPSARPVSLRAGAGIYVGLSCVTAATLMLEIALTRIFSVTMWYHFAFVAISVALFGMTVGALAVHLLPHRFPAAGVRRQLWMFSLLFGLSVVVCFAVQLLIPFTPLATVPGIASVVATCVVISVPFVFSGIVVCLALTRFPDEVNRLYAVDLVGAGLGCILLVVLFSVVDGPSLIVLVGGLAAIGALAFALTGLSRRRVAVAAVAVAVLVGLAGTNAALFAAGSPLLRIIWAKQMREGDHLTERWNAFSRLVVDRVLDDPDALSILIDSSAGTQLNRWSGDPDESDHLRDEMQNLPYSIRHDPDVFVIGAGGGTDVLSALEFGAHSVTGVEMNGDILDLAHNRYGDFTGHLDEQPGVRIVEDEARSYLTREDERYDLIQISLIDTWAATAAGAFALTENSLYTKEAWELYMDRLNEGGVLSVTRYYRSLDRDGVEVAPLESYRTLALASQVLTDRGVENPRDHIVVYREKTPIPGIDLATFLVSPDPISDLDRRALKDTADTYGFTPVLDGEIVSDQVFADLTRPGGPAEAVAEQTADISPPTDNRPFFFQMANLETFFNGDIQRDDHVTRPVLVLGLLAVTVVALAASCVAFPLLIGRRSSQRPAPRDVVPFYVYFLGIGLGFLLVEVAMLQRLSLFLGHPMYGLAVVLFSVLVFSGIGSMLTERIIRPERPRSLLVPLGFLAAMVVAAGILTPRVTDAMDGATTPARIATSVLLLAPLALAMGMPFSVGMRAAAAVPRAPTAFLWGINGAASVCASVMGVVIALFFGIAAAFWTGGLAYALAVASLVVITSRRAPAPAPVVEAEPEPDLVAAPG